MIFFVLQNIVSVSIDSDFGGESEQVEKAERDKTSSACSQSTVAEQLGSMRNQARSLAFAIVVLSKDRRVLKHVTDAAKSKVWYTAHNHS